MPPKKQKNRKKRERKDKLTEENGRQTLSFSTEWVYRVVHHSIFFCFMMMDGMGSSLMFGGDDEGGSERFLTAPWARVRLCVWCLR